MYLRRGAKVNCRRNLQGNFPPLRHQPRLPHPHAGAQRVPEARGGPLRRDRERHPESAGAEDLSAGGRGTRARGPAGAADERGEYSGAVRGEGGLSASDPRETSCRRMISSVETAARVPRQLHGPAANFRWDLIARLDHLGIDPLLSARCYWIRSVTCLIRSADVDSRPYGRHCEQTSAMGCRRRRIPSAQLLG